MDAVDRFREIAFPIVRFGSFTANAILFGLVPILLLVLRPGFKRLRGETWVEGRAGVADRLEGLVEAALVASAAATLLIIVLQALQVAEIRGTQVDGAAFGSVFETPYGKWIGLRIPLLIALGVLLAGKVKSVALKGTDEDGHEPSSVFWGIWAAFGLALLATSTFSGHSAVATPKGLAVVNDLLHLISGATWFTGIVVLAVVLPPALKIAPEPTQLLSPVVTRFSQVALVAIGVVVVTGTINSFLHVGMLSDLTGTGYGLAVTTKIALMVVILGTGALNHFVIRRRLEARPRGSEGSAVQATFRKLIALELVVGLAIMGATGVLTNLGRTKQTVLHGPTGAPPAVIPKD